MRRILLLGPLLLSACATSVAMSQYLPCSSDEIKIDDHRSGWDSGTWTASCRGHTYHCSRAAFQEPQCRDVTNEHPDGGSTRK